MNESIFWYIYFNYSNNIFNSIVNWLGVMLLMIVWLGVGFY